MINNLKFSTALEAAKDLIRNYVLAGQSFEELKESFLSSDTSKYWAGIGGYVNQRWISSRFIVVKALNGVEIEPRIFELKELFNSIKNETNRGTKNFIPIQQTLFD